MVCFKSAHLTQQQGVFSWFPPLWLLLFNKLLLNSCSLLDSEVMLRIPERHHSCPPCTSAPSYEHFLSFHFMDGIWAELLALVLSLSSVPICPLLAAVCSLPHKLTGILPGPSDLLSPLEAMLNVMSRLGSHPQWSSSTSVIPVCSPLPWVQTGHVAHF
jgi:hypothetical protein